MGGLRPGPVHHSFSRVLSAPTPGPLGCNDAADPDSLALRFDTPSCLGINDNADINLLRSLDPLDYDFVVRHHELKSHLIESVRLDSLRISNKHWKKASIWKIGEALVFRVTQLSEDLDGSARAYHPPTDASWNGFGPHSGLGKDSLANAVGSPGVTAYAHSKKESDWALTAGCEILRDLAKARTLDPKAALAGKPPAAGADPAAAAKAAAEAQAAKAQLDALFKKHGVTKLADLQTQAKSAVCVLYDVPGRPKADARADWSHVTHWAGIQTDASGKPIVRASGPNKGFYIPAITPGWADAEVHPWVVLNPPQDQFGVNLTNSAVVIQNSEDPVPTFGMVADIGPEGHLGEVSSQMLADIGPDATKTGDFILIQFPQAVAPADRAKSKTAAEIRTAAKAAFEAWTFEGRSGLDVIKELFPSPEQYHRSQRDLLDSRRYLSAAGSSLQLKL